MENKLRGWFLALNIFIHVNLCEAQLLYSKWRETGGGVLWNLEGFLFEGPCHKHYHTFYIFLQRRVVVFLKNIYK